MFRFSVVGFLISTFLFSNPRSEKKELLREIHILIKQENYEELLPKLETFVLKYPYEKKHKIYLAKTYLLKQMQDIAREYDPFQKEEMRSSIRKHYEKAQAIYSKEVPEWESISPNDRNLGFWYFEWALVEHILGNKQKAISLYKKSSQFHEFPKEVYYNLGVLFIELGLEKDAQRQLKKYFSNTSSEN